jgi:hypothetical protein
MCKKGPIEEYEGSIVTCAIPDDVALMFSKAPELVEALRELLDSPALKEEIEQHDLDGHDEPCSLCKARALLAELDKVQP